MSVELSIIATECKSACAGEPDLEKRCRKAMAVVAKDHWMFTGDRHSDTRFRGALAAVLLAPETTEEDKRRITNTLDHLRALNAMVSGVPVDMGSMMAELEANPPLPLVKWWHEARAA